MPKYHQPRKTWRYPNAFKVKAVQLSLQDGVQVKAVATALDIHPFMLSRWRKEFREGRIVADKRKKVVSITKDKQELDQVKALKKEVLRLEQENDLLKKWQLDFPDLTRHLVALESNSTRGVYVRQAVY